MTTEEPSRQEINLKATLSYVLDLLDQHGKLDGRLREAVEASEEAAPEIEVQLNDLRELLSQQHPADIAYVLESLPMERRELVWELISPAQRGHVLLELSEAVLEHMLSKLEEKDIIAAAGPLDSDQIAYLASSLPRDTVLSILAALDKQHRSEVQTALSAAPGSVGALMEFDVLTVRDDISLDVVLRYLRKRRPTEETADQLFVVDRKGIFKGRLPFKTILLNDPEELVVDVMLPTPVTFLADDLARDAVSAFERYDLISAPVVNTHYQLVGILSVDAVLDYINESAQRQHLQQAGLQEGEDLFGPIWKSGVNRWVWLAVNLLTAIISSRVIGAFEPVIEKLVALAALMPIVASIGGNTGNQTVALVIRGLALEQLDGSNVRYLLTKELGISLINGALWGGVLSLFAFLMYGQPRLAYVMLAATMLNLIIASVAGVFVPYLLHRLGRDPAFGSSVILTAITDSMGFLLFLGLAAIFISGM